MIASDSDRMHRVDTTSGARPRRPRADPTRAGGGPAPGAQALEHRRDERLFSALIAVSFPLFLVVAAASRWLPGAEQSAAERGSVFAEAAATARSTIAIALSD